MSPGGRGKVTRRRGGGGKPPSQRPTKTCPVCGRPFSWRRRWADKWDEVVYCSARCRQDRRGRGRDGTGR